MSVSHIGPAHDMGPTPLGHGETNTANRHSQPASELGDDSISIDGEPSERMATFAELKRSHDNNLQSLLTLKNVDDQLWQKHDELGDRLQSVEQKLTESTNEHTKLETTVQALQNKSKKSAHLVKILVPTAAVASGLAVSLAAYDLCKNNIPKNRQPT